MKKYRSDFCEMTQQASPGMRHCLRTCAGLMEKHGLSARELLALGPAEITRLLVENSIKDAMGLARRMPGALTHLAEKFPNAGLPITPAAPSTQHALQRRRDEPRQFRADVVGAWTAHKRRRAEDSKSVCTPLTFRTHVRSTREFLAAGCRAGIEVDDGVGLEALTYPSIALSTLDQLRDSYSPKTVLKIVGGVIAVARAVLEPDHPHLAWLGTQRGSRTLQPSRELSHPAEVMLARIMSSDGVQRLLAVPDQIEESALGPHCGRKDKLARLQYAFLLALKFDHLGLTETQGARLHLTTDIQVRDGRHFLVVSPTVKGGACTWEPMTERSVQRLSRLRTAKKTAGLPSALLFPTRKENFGAADNDERDGQGSRTPQFRGTGAVLNTLYREIKFFTGLDLTFMNITDVIVRVLLESRVDAFIVARRAGYRNVRSVELRMAALFRTRGAP